MDMVSNCFNMPLTQLLTQGYKAILLYSNKKLENSIYLYRKFGFKEVPNEDSPYARGNIKMLLKL
jgi:ribosomal protein S18 acetylase RimI-like enzyme